MMFHKKEQNYWVKLHSEAVKSVHNALRRSLAQIINVLETDKSVIETSKDGTLIINPSFKGYMEAFFLFLDAHHFHEDNHQFPMFLKKGIKVDTLKDDHHKLEESMQKIESILQGKTPISSPEALIESMTQLQAFMEPHLQVEEKLTSAESMIEAGITDDDVKVVDKGIQEDFQKKDGTIAVPFLYYELNEKERKEFWDVNMPWMLRKIIFPFVLKKAHADYWKYSTFSPMTH